MADFIWPGVHREIAEKLAVNGVVSVSAYLRELMMHEQAALEFGDPVDPKFVRIEGDKTMTTRNLGPVIDMFEADLFGEAK